MRQIVVILLLAIAMSAQSQQLVVAGFTQDISDQTANNNSTRKIDDNGEVCALIRVQTTQKGFSFDGGTIGIVTVDEDHIGEIWVFVPPGLRRISIRHAQLGSLTNYYFDIPIESARTYLMTLVSGESQTVVKPKASSQYLALSYSPANAMVEIDGVIQDAKNGYLSVYLPFGKHDYRISAKDYHTEVGRVTLGTEKEELTVNLMPAFGWLHVLKPAGASVYINNERVGQVPYKSRPLPSGQYDVRIAKEKYMPYREQVTINDEQTVVIEQTLQSNFSVVSVTTQKDAEIWVNEVRQGIGKVRMELIPGEYIFESRKENCHAGVVVRNITAAGTDTVEIPAPMPKTGTMKVTANVVGATVTMDGRNVGSTPLLLEKVMIGTRRLRISHPTKGDVFRSVEVRDGETSEVAVDFDVKAVTEEGVVVENGVLRKVARDYSGQFAVPDGVTRVDSRAMAECAMVTGIVMPASIKSIGECAFAWCKALKKIDIPSSVMWIGRWAFYYAQALESVVIPEGVTSIEYSTFCGCQALREVTIPSTVTRIDKYAFDSCLSLTSVTIPTSVKSVDKWAFRDCSALTTVTIKGTSVVIGAEAFMGCPQLMEIIIPRNTLAYYKKTLHPGLHRFLVEAQ